MRSKESLALANTMLETPVYKLLIKYSIPAVIGMLVSAMYNVVDRIFIGNIPETGAMAITGVGVTMPLSTIIIAFGMLFGVGAAANISIKLGQGKMKDAERILGNSLSLSVVTGLILTTIGLIFCTPILKSFGASNDSLYFAKKYMDIILLGTVFNVAGFVLNSSIRTDGSPKISAGIMILSCLVNIILDPIFIFNLNMGIAGAACATILSQMISFILSIWYYFSSRSKMKINTKGLKLNFSISKLIITIGISPFIMQLIGSLIQVINNNILKTHGGDYAIGAMATINGVIIMCLMPIFGIAQGSQPIIGYNYGAKNYKRVKETVFISTGVAFALLILPYLAIQFFPQTIVGAFNKEPKMLETATRGLKLYTLFMPLIGVGMMGTQFFQAIAKPIKSLILSLTRQALLLIPVTLILVRFMGIDAVWIAQSVSDFFTAIIVVYFVYREFKKFSKYENEADPLNEFVTLEENYESN